VRHPADGSAPSTGHSSITGKALATTVLIAAAIRAAGPNIVNRYEGYHLNMVASKKE